MGEHEPAAVRGSMRACILWCLLAGCGGAAPGSGGDGGGGGVPDLGPSLPSMPLPGTQIDRVGRPLVGIALLDPFDVDTNHLAALQDGYNGDDAEAGWAAAHAPAIAATLALYDGWDAVCGNQTGAGPSAMAGRYDHLAAVLADDELWLDTTTARCDGSFFGLEVALLGGPAATGCGGRAPAEGVADALFGLVIAGDRAAVPTGAAQDADHPAVDEPWPFLGNPN
jgi:hypothetical protein